MPVSGRSLPQQRIHSQPLPFRVAPIPAKSRVRGQGRNTQAFRSAPASACRNTTRSSGINEITKSSPSGRIATFRLSDRLIAPIRSDMNALRWLTRFA
jgi:hypothetical protein